MVEQHPEDGADYGELARLILKPLREMRRVRPPVMAGRMGLGARAYWDFENGRSGMVLDRLLLFAEILELDHVALLAAFQLRRPAIALIFAHNKALLIQMSAIDELDDETLEAIAAVDPLTTLDAHLQFYRQIADHGREQLRAKRGRSR